MAKEVLVVASKVKEYIKSKDCMSAGDIPEALSEKVYKLIDDAIERTKANGRATVQPKDL
jgi:histone H3/H4